MNSEEKLINAVCKNKDISVLMAENVDDLFVAYKDVWAEIKNYWFKYKQVPDAEVLADKFGDFDIFEPKADTKFYLDELRNEFIANRIRSLFTDKGRKLNEVASAEVLQEIVAETAILLRLSDTVRDLNITDLDAAEQYYEAQAIKTAMAGGTPGIPTGFPAIDSAYSTGMAPGHLIVLIGWPGRGKTWFSAYLACKAHEAGYKPLIVSLEMSPEGMRDRLYTIMGSGLFRNSDLVRGNVALDDFRSWGKKKFADKNDFIIVSNEGEIEVTPTTVQAKIDQHRPDLVICDYHQLFSDSKHSNNEVERNKNISREFKQLAMRNSMPIIDITAATMSDISDQKTAPMLSQVAWSKAIEYDADIAMAVHKELDSNIVEVVSRKNRHGPEFAFYLDWDINRGVIKELYGDEE